MSFTFPNETPAGTNLKYNMFSMTGKMINLFWAAAQSNKHKVWSIKCMLFNKERARRMTHSYALKVEGNSCLKIRSAGT